MTSQPLRNLNLPAVPLELKQLSTYLQRADEVKGQEPIIAYWCSYYAAQLGISTKTNQPTTRNFLSSLIAVLETLKKEIGPSDAVDNDVASAAYVENFALRIFDMADREDRSAKATRGTAKKFLAAANFLELLKVFNGAGVSELIDDKIRYAKWKAADIAKALREGRKPTPGPANNSGLESDDPESYHQPEIPDSDIVHSSVAPLSPSENNNNPSATETPGYYHEHVVTRESNEPVPRSGTAMITPPPERQDAVEIGVPPTRPAWVDDELEGQMEETTVSDSQASLSTTNDDLYIYVDQPPQGYVYTYTEDAPMVLSSVESPPTNAELFSVPIPPPLPPPLISIQQPQPPRSFVSQPQFRVPPPPPPEPQGEPELTPQQIAKAQKHCKFAISALDYEDFAQARKDLREALRILGN